MQLALWCSSIGKAYYNKCHLLLLLMNLCSCQATAQNALKAKSCCELIFLVVCPCAQKGSQQSLEEDAGSLDRTQKAVRQAMQDVHDMPVEESVRDFYFGI